MLKVAFNGAALLWPLTGIGQYAYHLARGIQQGEQDIDLQLFYGAKFERQVRPGAAPMVGRARQIVRRWVPKAYEINRWLAQRNFDRALAKNAFDLYHEPNFLAFRFEAPSILTVHDLSWIRYPHTHPPERVRAMNKYFQPGLSRARLVLTDSQFVKRELIEVFGMDGDLIRSVPLGLDPVFRPMGPEQTRDVLAARGLEHGGYFLSVGTMEPRKNIQTSVAAYSRLQQAVRKRHPLVIVGLKGWKTTAMEEVLEPLVRNGEVRILGYLERSELATITAGAMAMVYPSLYEGFGLPPLEAMGCGVPAITSNGSSLPEVVGDTGLSVDPLDVEALTSAMHRISDDAPLREALSAKAFARARGFTWERCAAETAAAYRLAAGAQPRAASVQAAGTRP